MSGFFDVRLTSLRESLCDVVSRTRRKPSHVLGHLVLVPDEEMIDAGESHAARRFGKRRDTSVEGFERAELIAVTEQQEFWLFAGGQEADIEHGEWRCDRNQLLDGDVVVSDL